MTENEQLRLKKVLEIKLEPPPSGEFLEALGEAAWDGLLDAAGYEQQTLELF